MGVVEEILVMILEIVNSCLSHRLATNPHLVYCLLYQREVFSPLHTSPPLMDLVRNILSVSLLLSSPSFRNGSQYSVSQFDICITNIQKNYISNANSL